MSLSVSLMAHPKRQLWVGDLCDSLDRAPLIAWDRHNDVWETGRRALLLHTEKATTHALILQDDAIIPPNLYETCERILEHTPDDVPISLYMGRWRHRPRRYPMKPVVQAAREADASFAVFGGPYWGVGIIVPTEHIEAIVAHGDQNQRHKNYDIKIAKFYADKGIDCWYTTPSVIEHREGPSLAGPRGRRRHAQWYELDVSGVDWSSGAITEAEMDLSRAVPPLP